MRSFRCLAFTATVLAAISPVIAQDDPEELKAVKKIELLRGRVFVSLDTGEGSHVVRVAFPKGSRVNDKYLYLLGTLPHLSSVDLSRTKVTDEGLKHVGQLSVLKRLDLGHTSITDVGIKELQQLKQLSCLDIGGTAVTDDGIESLTQLANLTTLKIAGTQITDQGLLRLSDLKKLDHIVLTERPGSLAAIHELRMFLPELKVSFVPMDS